VASTHYRGAARPVVFLAPWSAASREKFPAGLWIGKLFVWPSGAFRPPFGGSVMRVKNGVARRPSALRILAATVHRHSSPHEACPSSTRPLPRRSNVADMPGVPSSVTIVPGTFVHGHGVDCLRACEKNHMSGPLAGVRVPTLSRKGGSRRSARQMWAISNDLPGGFDGLGGTGRRPDCLTGKCEDPFLPSARPADQYAPRISGKWLRGPMFVSTSGLRLRQAAVVEPPV